jgi:hypothetical protein
MSGGRARCQQRGRIEMLKNRFLIITAAGIVLFLAGFFVYRHWSSSRPAGNREAMLALMPDDASAVVYADVEQLRASPFLAELLRWAPKVTPDADYAQFLQATGFNYETDLNRLALSINRQSPNATAFAVVDGKFDRKKIEAYGSRFASLETADGKTLFAVPLNHSSRKAFFTFLRDDRIAWSNDSSFFFQKKQSDSQADWREHFLRLAGTPLFAVLREDAGAAAALSQAPGGLHSPQLAALLAQLQWISIGAKPEGDLLRVAMEGECLTEGTERQLKEMLSGMVVLAQMGLNDPKTRKQLDPAVRDGYLALLQSADIQQVDRGTSKTVRVVFDVSPKLLEPPQAMTGTDPPENNKSKK